MFNAGMNDTGMSRCDLNRSDAIGQVEVNQTVKLIVGMLSLSLFAALLTQSTVLLAGPAATPEQKSQSMAPKSTVQINSASQKSLTVPPPPPGPYRSTALSDNTAGVRSSEKGGDKPGLHSFTRSESIDRFSPDRPWPDNLRPPTSQRQQSDTRPVSRNSNMRTPAVQRPATVYPTRPYYPDPSYPDPRQRAPMGVAPDSGARYYSNSPQNHPNYRPNYQAGYPPGSQSGYQSGNNEFYNNPANRPPYQQGRP